MDLGRFCASESHWAFLAPSLCVFSPCRDAVGAPPQGVGCRSRGRPILPSPVSLHLPPPDRLSWGPWPGGHYWGVCPHSIFMGTGRTPRDRQLLPPLIPPSPQASLPFQPCHQFSAVILPTPSSPSSSSQRHGAARTKHDELTSSSAHGRSLPITVPSCPSLSLCPHLSPALLLTNQLFIALHVPLRPSFLHLGEAAARPCFPSLIHTNPAPQEPLPGSVAG